MDTYFQNEKFDIVFCNLVLHHLIQSSWETTTRGQAELLGKIEKILNENGICCIHECYYGGFIFRDYFGKLVYLLTHTKNRFLLKFSRAFGSNAAGVGVCFHPPKVWKKMFEQANFIVNEEEVLVDRNMKHGLINERFFKFILSKHPDMTRDCMP